MPRPKPLELKVPLTISVPQSLKVDFLKTLELTDSNASLVLRAAMREYIEKHRVSP